METTTPRRRTLTESFRRQCTPSGEVPEARLKRHSVQSSARSRAMCRLQPDKHRDNLAERKRKRDAVPKTNRAAPTPPSPLPLHLPLRSFPFEIQSGSGARWTGRLRTQRSVPHRPRLPAQDCSKKMHDTIGQTTCVSVASKRMWCRRYYPGRTSRRLAGSTPGYAGMVAAVSSSKVLRFYWQACSAPSPTRAVAAENALHVSLSLSRVRGGSTIVAHLSRANLSYAT